MNDINSTQNNQNINWGKVLGFALLAFGAVKVIDELTANDESVVYYLYHRNELVYIGMAYADRLETRINEHACAGKVFDSYRYSRAVAREVAAEKERWLISRHRPKYNVHHNW